LQLTRAAAAAHMAAQLPWREKAGKKQLGLNEDAGHTTSYMPKAMNTTLPILPEPSARQRAEKPSGRRDRTHTNPSGEILTIVTPPPETPQSTPTPPATPSTPPVPKGTHVPTAGQRVTPAVRGKRSPRLFLQQQQQEPKPQPQPEPQPQPQTAAQTPRGSLGSSRGRKAEPFQATVRERDLLVGSETLGSSTFGRSTARFGTTRSLGQSRQRDGSAAGVASATVRKPGLDTSLWRTRGSPATARPNPNGRDRAAGEHWRWR